MELDMWVVYDHPTDYPNKFVARKHVVTICGSAPTQNIILADDIEAVREVLLAQMGLTRIPRQLDDDPKIMETWI